MLIHFVGVGGIDVNFVGVRVGGIDVVVGGGGGGVGGVYDIAAVVVCCRCSCPLLISTAVDFHCYNCRW